MTEATLPRPQARPAQPTPALPDRPRLADGVELRGEMTETAYKQPPWLIERDGAYLPVSRLLHTVAEECNGRQTLAEIAAAVSEKIQRNVTADDIAVIVGNLVQSGIVAGPNGSAVDALPVAPPSPLAVNMRMKMISPGVIDFFSRILQVLFWPPVVLVMLAAGAFAQAWVYVIHGIGGSLRDAIYAPGFVLLVLGVIVVAAAFHEFGHAAALRYAGGRAKTMGAGFYLFYPAFYTDVTDNYRLGRWSRLRTDLGGFYFHLIFALATIGAFLLTGWEPLLLIVVLINLEIIHQLLPFVRLDGYWALADLTGIPDFFSHMGPFIRSILPLPFLKKGGSMPELKLWAKVVFLFYILVTIPILLFVLIHLVIGVPRVLATAWDSLGQLWTGMQGSLANGDGLAVAGSIAQILVLVLMTGGLLFFLLTLARKALSVVWGWSKPTVPRRIAGALGTLATIALLVFLFAPATPLTGDQGGPLSGNFTPIQADEPMTLGDMSRQLLGGPRLGADGSPLPASSDDGAAVPSATPSTTPAPGASATQTPTPGAAATARPGASATPTPAPRATPTPSPTPTPTASPTPSPTPTLAP
jgi:putative peptide zinc metalloprotease protein